MTDATTDFSLRRSPQFLRFWAGHVGEFESTATAALVGPVASVALDGLGALLVAALWMRWFPELTKRDQLQEAKQTST